MAPDSDGRTERPDPQVEPLLELAAELPPLHDLSPEGARKQFEELGDAVEAPAVAEITDHEIEGPGGPLALRAYRPDAEGPLPTLVYLHGGGFVVGDLETHEAVCCELANRAGALVVAVDYRLAPEHTFPAALNDAYRAVEWVAEDGAEIGADTSRLVVGGDSAGGNLTAGVTLLARDRDGPAIDHQVLIYPAVNSRSLRPMDSYEENAEGFFLELADLDWFRDHYVDDPIHARNEYLAPLLARDLAGLPSATIVTAGFDPLRDEGIAYAEALADAGVAVGHEHYPSMVHGFVNLTGIVSQADDAVDRLAAAVRGPD